MNSPESKNNLVPAESNRRALQLQKLAGQFERHQPGNVLATVIETGQVDAMWVGTILANNTVLDDVLRLTAAYRFQLNSVTPASDFNLLSTGSSEEAVQALRRIVSGFYEARCSLAARCGEVEDVGPDDGLEYGEEINEQRAAQQEYERIFENVNASYALVISTVHQLFDSDDPSYRTKLLPEFLKLLEHDPYLTKLTPSFRDLLGSHSLGARKVALRTFFENFCDNAVEPYIYNQEFSAMVQSILLRELRHVITEEARLPVAERKLAPYLAELFEKRMRGELQTAQNKDGKDQPVLDSLRKCRGEAKLLMRSIAQFLVESHGEQEVGLALPPNQVISCEVMLSIGCLLPETDLITFLAKRLHQVDDLNPSLVLVFASALKFSLLSEAEAVVAPEELVKLGLKNLPAFASEEQERLVREVFAPFPSQFVQAVSEDGENWSQLSTELCELCIEEVLVQELKKLRDSNPEAKSAFLEKGAITISLDLLTRGGKLSELLLQELIRQGACGELSEEEVQGVLRATLGQGREAARFGVEPEEYESLILAGGLSAIELLGSSGGHEDRLSNAIAQFSSKGASEGERVYQVFDERLVRPLRVALGEYDYAVKQRRSADAAQMRSEDARGELRGLRDTLTQVSADYEAIDAALEEDEDYIKATLEHSELVTEIQRKEEYLEELRLTSRRELVKSGKENAENTILRSIEEHRKRADKLYRNPFELPSETVQSLQAFSGRTCSMKQLRDLELKRQSLQGKVQALEESRDEANNAKESSESSMAKEREKIKQLFHYVQVAVQSDAFESLDPESLSLTSPDAFDPLGMFCRVSLAVRVGGGKELQKSRSRRELLEEGVREALNLSFQDPESKTDSRLILLELVRLVEANAPLCYEWEKGSGKLLDFLQKKVWSDVSNSEMSWLGHDPGWDETMHGPIISLFGALLRSKVAAVKTKQDAMALCFPSVVYWMDRESPQGESDEASSLHPNEVIGAWSSVLRVSLGKSKAKAEQVQRVTKRFLEWGIKDVPLSSYDDLKRHHRPFVESLERCGKESASALSPLPEEALRYVAAYYTRVKEIKEEQKSKDKEIRQSVPESKEALGISFSDLRSSDGLSLPPPVHYGGRDVKRLSDDR